MTKNKLLYYSSSKTQNYIELYKDPGEIPHYFNKLFGYDAIIDDYYDSQYNYDKFHNVTLLRPFSHIKIVNSIAKIFRLFLYAHKIDILYLLQITPDSMYKMLAYRLGGGKGKIYLKLDLGIYAKDGKDMLKWGNMSLFLKIVHFLFKPLPDIYTVETNRSYERLKKSYYNDLIEKKRLFILPNCFDSGILDEVGVIRRTIPEKEKIMITVGRLGTYEKNTELLLKILAKVDLKDWKFYLIGPIENNFQSSINNFYRQNPSKKESVIFTGSIYDKKELFEYYNKSRVFVLTSRHEGFAFALVEAAYMKNYIVSTNVGGAEDVLDYTNGVLIDPMDENISHLFTMELEKIIDNWEYMVDNNIVSKKGESELTWENILRNNEGIARLIK